MTKKITVLTCYDYSFAKAIDGILDYVLVGDSVEMVVYGEKSTTSASLDKIYEHSKAVRKGLLKTKLISDIPKDSLSSPESLLKAAQKLKQAGADFLKIENNPQLIHSLSNIGYSLFGHIGYTPQTVTEPTLFGKNESEKVELLKQALEIQEAGASGIFLELIEKETAKIITEKLKIPTIGIGSGKDCSGQVLVLYDILGLYPDFKPSFVKQYEKLSDKVKTAVKNYSQDVQDLKFPT